MRVLAISVAPLFPAAVHGGSQRVLHQVALALGEAGHDVRVLCSARPENAGGFNLAPNVTVAPALPLSGRFPSPYEVAPYRLAGAAAALREGSEWSDRVYLHADAVFMRGTLRSKPVVRSLHDFVYEEALLSALTLDAALTLTPSDYLRRCVETAVRISGARELEEVRVVPNGVDVPPSPPLPAPPPGTRPREDGDLVLLYPHRPDVRKGVHESLAVTAELASRMKGRRVRLLVAGHVDEQVQASVAAYRDDVVRMSREAGAEGAVEFFPWLPPERMAGLYAFADVTLCIGNFIESFGLVPLESVAAGTPAVCARAGGLRDLEGIAGLWHVPYGDIRAATDAVDEAAGHRSLAAGAREVIAGRFTVDAMKRGYVEAITAPRIRPRPSPREGASRTAGAPEGRLFQMAPWCHVEGGRVYNDYEYGYVDLSGLAAYVGGAARTQREFSEASALAAGVTRDELARAVRAGVLFE
jgi:glycosyltransferase involved in cell wall biosynthesis